MILCPRTLLLVTLLFLLVGCSKTADPVDYGKLVERNGLHYEVNQKTPFTGKVFENYWTGRIEWEGTFKDGNLDGKCTEWYENGQKAEECTYKDGKEDGKATSWHENGQLWAEETFKDGKVIAEK